MADALLDDGRLRDRGIFNQREVSRLCREHREGRADHRHRLWQLVMLELWFQQFVDRGRADHRHRLWQLIMLELWFRQFVDRAPAARAVTPRRSPRDL